MGQVNLCVETINPSCGGGGVGMCMMIASGCESRRAIVSVLCLIVELLTVFQQLNTALLPSS